MRYPVIARGDATAVQKRVLSTGPCRLTAVVGVNNGTGVDPLYLQIHETAAEPAPGAVPKFHCPVDASRAYAFALPNPVDLDACTIVFSTTLSTYTAAAGTPGTIQALLAP